MIGLGRTRILGVLAGVLAWVLLLACTSNAGAAEWSVETTSNPTSVISSSLTDVACPSTSVCLALGTDSKAQRTIAQAWNGTSWTLVNGVSSRYSTKVSCGTTTSCWALGVPSTGTASPLVERWIEEEGEWYGFNSTTIATPSGGSGVTMAGISCTAASECTAVGYFTKESKTYSLSEKLSGSTWTVQSSAEVADGRLLDVSCTSSTNCVAVGYKQPSGKPRESFAMAWNGTSWSATTVPAPPSGTSPELRSVSCFSTTFCMANGRALGPEEEGYVSFAPTFNGTSWANTASMGFAEGETINDVSCASATNCSAVGSKSSGPLSAKWNGTTWTKGAPVNPSGKTAGFSALACPSASACESIGSASSGGEIFTLAERYVTLPETIISAGPGGPAYPNVSFSFSGAEGPLTFECSMDSGAFGACTSRKTYESLSEGKHTFRVRAVNAAGTDPTPAESSFKVFQPQNALARVSLLDDFGRSEVPLANGKWSKSSWGTEIGGSWSGSWHGYGANGSNDATAYWNQSTFSDASGSVSAAATVGTGSTASGEYVGIWLDMPNPGSARSGYEARFTGTNGTSTAYKAELSKWVGGTRTILATKENVSLPVNTTFILTETGGNLVLWTGSGSSYSALLTANDSTYTSGYAGIEVNKGNGTYYNFRAGNIDPRPNTTLADGTSGTAFPEGWFELSSDDPEATFECSMDGGSYAECAEGWPGENGPVAPWEEFYWDLSAGSHTFTARAVNTGGPDPTPVERTFQVLESGTASRKFPIVDDFNRTENPLAGKWSKIAWNESIGQSGTGSSRGYFATTGQSGAYWNQGTFNESPAPPLGISAKVGKLPTTGGSFSLWLDMPTPGGAREGYEARFTRKESGNFEVTIWYWYPNGGSGQGNVNYLPLAENDTITLIDNGRYLTMWMGHGNSLTRAVTMLQKQLSSGYAGIGAKGSGHLYDVRIGHMDLTPPNTTITEGPTGKVFPEAVKFTFTATESGSTFECSLDGAAYGSCPSPQSYTNLANGSHVFRVRAVDVAENPDPTPAERSFTVVRKPSATTTAASMVKTATATLNATVNPQNDPTTYQFEYGPTTAYGSKVPASPKSIGGGETDVQVSETLDGLEPNTTYHYRIVATNSNGTTNGADNTFTTPEWATITVEEAAGTTSDFADVWCISYGNCVGVGGSDVSGPNQAHIEHWGGTAWGVQAVSLPTTGYTSELEGVTCISSSFCVAVGSYDETQSDETTLTKTLSVVWDGETWSPAETPNPEGAADSRLSEVSCVSKTECVAVGRYIEIDEVEEEEVEDQKTLTMAWDGEKWAIASSPNASGGSKDELSGVSCAAAFNCRAVGSFVNGSNITKTLAMAWNGSSWTIESTPEPGGATLNQLADVKCLSTTNCTAVGNYFDAGGVEKTLVLNRTSGGWSVGSSPNPSGSLGTELSGVSCTESSACTAVGSYRNGTGLMPLALRWNGTSWTEQSVGADSFGAISVEFSSVSCTASTACHAAGSISFGHGGERRVLGYRWNGTSWSVNTAAGLERTWDRNAVANVGSGLEAVQCFASLEDCLAAGVFTDGFGVKRGRVSAATDVATPAPAGATASAVEAISCVSATQCAAVGSYRDAAQNEWALAVRRNESGWSNVGAPVPSGASSSHLAGVSCVTSSNCVAVGQYRSSAGVDTQLAMSWNGTAWSLMSASPPSGAISSELLDVDCAAASNCAAVGRYSDSEGKPQGLALHWDGSEWKSVKGVSALEAISSRLSAVDCPTTSACVAIGNYVDEEGNSRTLSMRSTAADPLYEWEFVKTPELSDEATGIASDLSCSSASRCVAVGTVNAEEGKVPLTLLLDEGEWAELALGVPSGLEGEEGYQLEAVWCLSATKCEAAGSVAAPGAQREDLTYAIVEEGGEWHASGQAGGPSSGGLTSVSCVRTSDPASPSCVAVGTHSDPTGSGGVSWTLSSNDGWHMVPFGETTGSLNDVGCSASNACTAVGDGTTSWVVRRFNGSSWSAQTSPTVSGASNVYARGVSCASATSCAVAGSSVKSGQTSPLLATWNGTSWSVQTVPLEIEGSPIILSDVSCTSAASCVAVGRTADGTKAAILRSSGGGSWSVEAALVPIGTATAELSGVSCTAANACTAVGSYRTSAAPTVNVGLIERWDGTGWSRQVAPSLQGSTSVTLADVSCFALSGCVAVAEGKTDSMLAWNGSVWKVEPTGFGAGQGFEYPGAVSCSSAIDCVAVGEIHGEGEEPAPLALRPREDALGSSGETSGGRSSVNPLTMTQKEQAEALVAEDPVLMAKIGSGEYTLRLIPFTETNGEGKQVFIGVAGVVLLNTPQAWESFESWPSVSWDSPTEPEPYVEGSARLSGQGVEELQLNLAATVDEAGNLVDGELIQLEPMETENADVTQDPEDMPNLTYNPEWEGY